MSFFTELKRRNVHRMALLYAVGAWILLQVTAVVLALLDLPEWPGRLVILLAVIGFPVAMIFSWVYELTPEGIKREKDVRRSESVTGETGRKITVIIVMLLALGISVFLVDRWIPELTRPDEVTAQAEPDSADAQQASLQAIPAKSIAVLPFADMSPDGDQEYFTDGLSEELLNMLAKISELKVAARTSSFSFKGTDADIAEIARELRVAHVLEGSLRKAGNTIRITAQLIKAADGYHLWSETWDRDLSDILAVQDETWQNLARCREREECKAKLISLGLLKDE